MIVSPNSGRLIVAGDISEEGSMFDPNVLEIPAKMLDREAAAGLGFPEGVCVARDGFVSLVKDHIAKCRAMSTNAPDDHAATAPPG